MLLNSFFQGAIHSRPEAGLQELMCAVVVRTNFVPAVRHRIGWRGVKQAAAAVECWTAKINGFAGVFGFSFDGLEPVCGWLGGRFALHYFPDPQEDVVERCSLQAGAAAQRQDYRSHIRDFLAYPKFNRLFAIGRISLWVDSTGKALALGLESLSAQRTIANDGVRIPRNGELVQVVAPGGRDEDFPAWEVASGFFDVVAASVAFNVEQAPAYLSEYRFSATQMVYDSTGPGREVEAADIWRGILVLGFGEGCFEELPTQKETPTPAPSYSMSWRRGAAHPEKYQHRLWWQAHQLKTLKSVDKKILGVDERPPLIILAGFLGSGKTSFLQHFIEYQTQRSRFVAVIQNEIGEIGLDGKLLDYQVTEIDEGCVCCSLIGSLKRAIQGILESFSPDAIVLETSGMANPKNLLDDMGELAEMVRCDATVTVVDALNFRSSLADYAIAADQVAVADILILNKSDLVGEAQLDEVRRQLARLNPNAPVCVTRRGDANPAMIFDAEAGSDPRDRQKAPFAGLASAQAHPTHAQDGLCAQTFRLPRMLDRSRFLEAVDRLPASIFRIKGIVDVSGAPQTMLFQYVAGRYELSSFSDAPVSDRFLTVIGKAADPAAYRQVEDLLRSAEV